MQGTHQIETKHFKGIMCYNWKNQIVSHNEMHYEIINKATQYIDEVRQINKKLISGKRLTALKQMILLG